MSLVNTAPDQRPASLLLAIDPQMPAGLFDIEDETYQAIDQEMVKLGGLHEASIDWSYIEEAAQQYLGSRCKQLRIVGHLTTAWLRRRHWGAWRDALELLAGMVEQYWESGYPKPGPTGFLTKRKLVAGLLKRLGDALPTLERASFSPACLERAKQAMTRLLEQAERAQLDQLVLLELERLLVRHGDRAVAVPEHEPLSVAQSPSGESLTKALLPSRSSLSLGNERETRKALLSMAEFINQQDVYDPTGYQLRRFGLWAHIHAAPSARHEQRTELMAVPGDIAAGYQEALSATSVEPALLMRIEKSVAAAPYWIRGSFLASAIASRLAMGEVAEAIRQATERFVRRLPALQQLCFSDGSAFVDAQCLAWLKGTDQVSGSDGAGHGFHGLREELVAQLEQQGVEQVLLKLQALQAEYRSPRERCHATLIAAQLLASRGLSWLADDLSAGVARTMQATTAEQWEPDVYHKLKQCGDPSRLID